jgi:hypothetical protein
MIRWHDAAGYRASLAFLAGAHKILAEEMCGPSDPASRRLPIVPAHLMATVAPLADSDNVPAILWHVRKPF